MPTTAQQPFFYVQLALIAAHCVRKRGHMNVAAVSSRSSRSDQRYYCSANRLTCRVTLNWLVSCTKCVSVGATLQIAEFSCAHYLPIKVVLGATWPLLERGSRGALLYWLHPVENMEGKGSGCDSDEWDKVSAPSHQELSGKLVQFRSRRALRCPAGSLDCSITVQKLTAI